MTTLNEASEHVINVQDFLGQGKSSKTTAVLSKSALETLLYGGDAIRIDRNNNEREN